MDRGTLLAHRAQWSSEAAPQTGELGHLDPEEQALYDDLRRDRLGSAVRLEQERIRFGYARAVVLLDRHGDVEGEAGQSVGSGR
jgi:hypothetical protein